jgi:hypothetical protein
MHIAVRQAGGYTVERISNKCGDCPSSVIDADGAFEIAKETYVPDIAHNLTKVVLSGTNYVPSIFAPSVPGCLAIAILITLWAGILKRSWWSLVVVALLVVLGAFLGAYGIDGPGFHRTVVNDVPVSFEKQVQSATDREPAECNPLPPPTPRTLGPISTPQGRLATVCLMLTGNHYYIHVTNASHPGKYEGTVTYSAAGFDKTNVLVNVSDWLPYLFITFALGVLVTYSSTNKLFDSAPKLLTASVISVAALATVIASAFAQYTNTWGTPIDYLKIFLLGAAVTIGTKAGVSVAVKVYDLMKAH